VPTSRPATGDAPCPAYRNTRHAISTFPNCSPCLGVRLAGGRLEVFAPYGLTDLFPMRTRPNPILAPASVYQAKTIRWGQQWPDLTVLPGCLNPRSCVTQCTTSVRPSVWRGVAHFKSVGDAGLVAHIELGCVVGLSRYPVKSTAGESLQVADFDERGVVGDRAWAMYLTDGGIVSGKTTRRFRKVDAAMLWRSTLPADGPGVPTLHAPDGREFLTDDPLAAPALSSAFEQPVTLRTETTVRHHDESGVHLVTTSSIRQIEQAVGAHIDPSRLRANIVLDTDGVGFVENDWVDADLAIGDEVVLRLGPGMPRCVMVDQPQAAVDDGTPILKAIGAAHDVRLGLQASVLRTGRIVLGAHATLSR
jgi:uncharacterized protein